MATAKIKTSGFRPEEMERYNVIDKCLADPDFVSTTGNIADACREELLKKGYAAKSSERTINDDINNLRAYIRKNMADQIDEDDEIICEVKPHLTLENGVVPELTESNKTVDVCLQTIADCLTDEKGIYSKTDLFDTCNKCLKENGLEPIGTKKFNTILSKIRTVTVPKCWRYTNLNYSLQRSLPNTEVFANFQELLIFLDKLPSDKYDWADEAARNIKASFGLPTVTEDTLAFDQSNNSQLKSCFPDILKAINEKRTITIWYTARNSNKEKEKEVVKSVSPYFLKQYGKQWQLYAKVAGSKRSYDQFSLDRIADVNEFCDLPYEPTDIDFRKELEDVIGFTVPNHKHKIEPIKLLVSEGKYPFLRDTPLHASQHVIERRGKDYIIGIDVTPNLELEKQLLINVDGVTVLEPPTLKEQIEDYLTEALKRYRDEEETSKE